MSDRWWCGNCNKPIGWSEKSGDIHKSCGCIVEYIDPAIAEFFRAEGAKEAACTAEEMGEDEVARVILARSKEVDHE